MELNLEVLCLRTSMPLVIRRKRRKVKKFLGEVDEEMIKTDKT